MRNKKWSACALKNSSLILVVIAHHWQIDDTCQGEQHNFCAEQSSKAILNVQRNYGKSLEPCSERVASSNNKHIHIYRNVMKTIGLPFHMETNLNAKSKGWIYFQKDFWPFVRVHTESSISSNHNYSVKVLSTGDFQKGLSSFRTKVDSLSSVTWEWLICTGLEDHHTGTTVYPISTTCPQT